MYKVNQRVRIIAAGPFFRFLIGREATITAIPVPEGRIDEGEGGIHYDCTVLIDGWTPGAGAHPDMAVPFFAIAPLTNPDAESDDDFAVRQVRDLQRLADRAPMSPVKVEPEPVRAGGRS